MHRILAAVFFFLASQQIVAEPLKGMPVEFADNTNFDEYDKKKGLIAAKNISAAVCMASGPCFAASDEVRFAQSFTFTDDTIQVGGRLYLEKTKDKNKKEREDFDIEALASYQDYLIAVGSHSWARKNCVAKPDTQQLFIGKVEIDKIGTRKPMDARAISLRPAFEVFPMLDHFYDKALQKNGLNIEGATVLGTRVYFGFRAPYVLGRKNRVLVLSVEFEALRNADFTEAILHSVALHGQAGLGIRGMESFGDSIILLTGDAGVRGQTDHGVCADDSAHREKRFSLHLWKPESSQAKFLTALEKPSSEWKAEGLLLAPESQITDSEVSLIIFFDKPKNGAPYLFTVPATD